MKEALAMTDTKISNAMAHITMRIPVKTLEYFQRHDNPRTFMREILVAYAEMKIKKDQD